MGIFAKTGCLLIILAIQPATMVGAQTNTDDFYRQWIDYRDGEISFAFEQIPMQLALYAFHARTGLQIVVPSTTQAQLVNLRLDHQPIEPAVRSLISTIGYRNFAMMYDASGRPQRAVVLSTQPIPSALSTEPAPTSLTVEERNQLKKGLESWSELKSEERSRIEARLKTLTPSDDQEILVREYGRQLLGLNK
jgi:hypothetical protein